MEDRSVPTPAEPTHSPDRHADLHDVEPVGCLTLDHTGTVLEANMTAATLLGIERARLVGLRLSRFVAREWQDTLQRHCAAVAGSDQEQVCELVLRREDGAVFPARIETVRESKTGSRVPGQRSTITDIAARRQAEEDVRRSASELAVANVGLRGSLRSAVKRMDEAVTARTEAERSAAALSASEERLRLAQQVALVGTFEWDVLSGVIHWTPELEAMHGLPPGGFAGTQEAWLELIHPDDRAEVLDRVKQSLETGAATEGEWRVIGPDGIQRWFAGRWRAIKDQTGPPLRLTGVHIDITARKRSEAQLAWNARRDKLLSDIAKRFLETGDPQAIVEDVCRQAMTFLDGHVFFNFMVSRNGARLYLNSCAGIAEEEMRKIRWLDYGTAVCGCVARDGRRIVVEDIAHTNDPRTDLIKSYGVQAYCCHPLTISGRLIGTLSFGSRARPRFRPEEIELMEAVASLVATAMYRIEMERALREREERLRVQIERMPIACILHDAQSRLTGWNPAAERIFGYTVAEVLGRPFSDLLVPAQQREEVRGIMDHVAEGEMESRVTRENRTKDGRTILCRWTHTVIRDAEGRSVGYLSMAEDVTQQALAERSLRQAQQDMERAQEVGSIGSWRFDARQNAITWSEQNYRIFGIRKGTTVTYELFLETVHPDDRAYVEARWQAALRGEAYDIAHRIIVEGQVRWVREKAYLEYDDAGNVIEGIGITQDITVLKRAEESLREISRRKDDFLATLAHELRNPLTPIRNAAFVLSSKTASDPCLARACGIIEHQVNYMVRLVDDLLDTSRIERGRIELSRTRVDLREAVRHAMDACRPGILAHRHRATVHLPNDPLAVNGDPVRLEQIVTNLLDNATKYTPDGGQIRICVQREGPHAVVRVWDNGIGMTSETAARVFDPFFQADHSLARTEGGLGIGLSLVKRLVALHGGSVCAHSEGQGRGSEFLLKLPALEPMNVRPASIQERPATLPTVTPAHVLVIDDNQHVRESVQMLLESVGFRVSVAADGIQGIERARALQPDVAIVDLGLPGKNGFQVAASIRAALGHAIYLIALSGHSTERDRSGAHAAGFDAHLTKPVHPDLLLKMLNERADNRSRHEPAATDRPARRTVP